jgi:hypothetical protein
MMFICYRGDKILQEGVVGSLMKISEKHEYSKKLLKEFVEEHGDKQHKISKTTFKTELKSFSKLAKNIDIEIA